MLEFRIHKLKFSDCIYLVNCVTATCIWNGSRQEIWKVSFVACIYLYFYKCEYKLCMCACIKMHLCKYIFVFIFLYMHLCISCRLLYSVLYIHAYLFFFSVYAMWSYSWNCLKFTLVLNFCYYSYCCYCWWLFKVKKSIYCAHSHIYIYKYICSYINI